MCIIIHRPAGATIPVENLKNCMERNGDGWGIMYFDQDTGQIVQKKAQKMAKFLPYYESLEGREIAIHMRRKTHGDINPAMAHPFKVLSRKRHGKDMFLMHNGVIRKAPEFDKKKSDTWHFIEHQLRPLLEVDQSLIDHDVFNAMVEDWIGESKLLTLDSDGKFRFHNKEKGADLFGCWFSNTYSHTFVAPKPVVNNYYNGGSWGYPKQGTLPGTATAGSAVKSAAKPIAAVGNAVQPRVGYMANELRPSIWIKNPQTQIGQRCNLLHLRPANINVEAWQYKALKLEPPKSDAKAQAHEDSKAFAKQYLKKIDEDYRLTWQMQLQHYPEFDGDMLIGLKDWEIAYLIDYHLPVLCDFVASHTKLANKDRAKLASKAAKMPFEFHDLVCGIRDELEIEMEEEEAERQNRSHVVNDWPVALPF